MSNTQFPDNPCKQAFAFGDFRSLERSMMADRLKMIDRLKKPTWVEVRIWWVTENRQVITTQLWVDESLTTIDDAVKRQERLYAPWLYQGWIRESEYRDFRQMIEVRRHLANGDPIGFKQELRAFARKGVAQYEFFDDRLWPYQQKMIDDVVNRDDYFEAVKFYAEQENRKLAT